MCDAAPLAGGARLDRGTIGDRAHSAHRGTIVAHPRMTTERGPT